MLERKRVKSAEEGMELLQGFPLFRQQLGALIRKNATITWRSKRSAFVQIFSSIFFIFIIFLVDKATRSRLADTTAFKNVFDPEALVDPPIPPCEDKFYVKNPCYDFVWSGNESSRIKKIVDSIMVNNPGRPIPADKVLSFRTADDVDVWLLANPMQCPGALHFTEISSKVISYGIQTNSTPLAKRGLFEDPTFKFQFPLQIAAEREIARSIIGDSSFRWSVGVKEFAHPAIQTFSAVGQAGPTFFLAMAMFSFVFQISNLVTEKELKLRQAMSIMGLYDSAYWLSWLIWETLLTFFSALFTVLFGMLYQFNFFLNNSFGVVFFTFFLFQFNMLGFAFMISAFISQAASATTRGFAIYIVGFLTQLVTTFGFPYASNFPKTYQIIWSLFPPNLFAQALNLLGDATATSEDDGISWRRRGECPSSNTDCVLTIEDVHKWLISTFFLWFLLAIYLDNIVPDANGVRKSMLYFLWPSYWTGKGGNRVEGGICGCAGSISAPDDSVPDDEDVRREEVSVRAQEVNPGQRSDVAVQLRGLAKAYPGSTSLGCFKCRRTRPYHAVKGLWLNLERDRLFCLLGPNGAGKTTAINCLTGITPVTGGDALIYGYSVRSSTGMANIRRMIGVCPQFDILWDALSGEEHLRLFSSIKGVPSSEINSVTETSLAEVKLSEAATRRAGSYSGGMKRRLSVAIALIADPKVVFLDEPTTGMDPITRRHVWDIIENAKKGRAIILTTHSMEEADVLSDRIGIMAKGKLRCLGTSIRLKSKFGAGYVANISFLGNEPGKTPKQDVSDGSLQPPVGAVKEFFKERLGIMPKEESRTMLTFVIPREKERFLTGFFAELQERENEFMISDIQLGLATLEEVFLNIAKQAELENSSSEGSLVTLNLPSGNIQVPKGARFIGIPRSENDENPNGLMVEVFWDQDESGNLCVSGYSSEMPIPANVARPTLQPVTRTLFGGSAMPVGFVIDPNQIHSHSDQQ
ncbi:ABC transporter A family member 2-like [Wolffia australiana]